MNGKLTIRFEFQLARCGDGDGSGIPANSRLPEGGFRKISGDSSRSPCAREGQQSHSS